MDTILHLAYKRDPPEDVIRVLCKASTVSDETLDLYNKLPIHYATEEGASIEVIKTFVDVCQDSIIGVDNKGRTSLHISFVLSATNTGVLVTQLFILELFDCCFILQRKTTATFFPNQHQHIQRQDGNALPVNFNASNSASKSGNALGGLNYGWKIYYSKTFEEQ